MRIAYCIEGFYNHGGMERVVSVKANWLSEHGHDVTIIVALQKGLATAFTLGRSVTLVDLQCDMRDLKSSYKGKLTQHLNHNTYDVVISTGGIESLFLWKIKDHSHKIVEFHFAWNRFFVMSDKLKGKIKAVWQTARQLRCASKYERAILLTHRDAKFYRPFTSNTSVIPNPLTIQPGRTSDCKSKNAIAIGRLNYQKGFDLLIRSWKIVAVKHPDWKLSIYGDGELQEALSNLIEKAGLCGTVSLMGCSSHIGDKIAESSIHICSSRYEGFSLVIAEASLCGVPTVAYDCIAGPGELIDDGVSGVLVRPVGDIEAMARGICKLIEDETLRKSMSQEAQTVASRLALDKIMHKWEQLFSHLTHTQPCG